MGNLACTAGLALALGLPSLPSWRWIAKIHKGGPGVPFYKPPFSPRICRSRGGVGGPSLSCVRTSEQWEACEPAGEGAMAVWTRLLLQKRPLAIGKARPGRPRNQKLLWLPLVPERWCLWGAIPGVWPPPPRGVCAAACPLGSSGQQESCCPSQTGPLLWGEQEDQGRGGSSLWWASFGGGNVDHCGGGDVSVSTLLFLTLDVWTRPLAAQD